MFDDTPVTRPDGRRRLDSTPEADLYFRQGLMMRDIEDLKDRVAFLERVPLHRSVRPQTQTAGISVVTAGTIVGMIEILQYFLK
jgi:hypothetical protein